MAFQAILSLKRQVASIPKCSPGRCLLLHLQLHLPHPRQHRLHHRRHHLLPRLQHQHCLRAPPEPSWDRYSSWSYGKMLDPKRNPIKVQFWKDTRTSKEKKRSKQIKVKGDRNRSKEFEGYQKQMICNLLEGRYHILLVYAHKTSELMGGWHRSTAVAYTFIATKCNWNKHPKVAKTSHPWRPPNESRQPPIDDVPRKRARQSAAESPRAPKPVKTGRNLP